MTKALCAAAGQCVPHVVAGLLLLAAGLSQSLAQGITPARNPTRVATEPVAVSSTQLGGGSSVWIPTSIQVFATSAMYIANAERATVHRVDGRKQLMADINQAGLPANPEQAMATARKRIQAMGPDFNRRVADALQAVEQSLVLGVRRLPAVVLDGRLVVYGVTDVAQAIDIARRGGAAPIAARFVVGRPTGSLHYESPATQAQGAAVRSTSGAVAGVKAGQLGAATSREATR